MPSAHVSMFIYHARHWIVPGILRYQTIIFEKSKRGKKHISGVLGVLHSNKYFLKNCVNGHIVYV